MSVRPVDFNGMIQRTQDVTTIKQNEDNRPVVEQHNIQIQQKQQAEELPHKVVRKDQKENEEFRYDAREKGGGSYSGGGSRKKKQKKEETEEDGKVILKGPSRRFDMKV